MIGPGRGRQAALNVADPTDATAEADGHAAAKPHSSPPKATHRWLMRAIIVGALCLAGFLLYRTLSRYTLGEIVDSVTAIPPLRLALAGGFAFASYVCLTGFDMLAVRYAGHALPYSKTAFASFTALSIGHNIGLAALSSGAIRYRFYSRWGLSANDVAKVILFCGATVGLGLMVLGGVALILRPSLAQDVTGLTKPIIFAVGGVCLTLPLVYLGLCARLRQPLRIRTWSFDMPKPRLALGQLLIGPLNFALVAGCLHQALAAAADVTYLSVAPVYVIANVTSLISHVPGGLGVIESVVMFLLPNAELIGALIVFRFVYFFVPLGIGSVVFAVAEFSRRQT